MIKVGLTGGIGSGKTTVSRVFQTLGIPVYYSDTEAKNLLNDNPDVVDKIKDIFGQDVYESGVLNRKKLAKIVFGTPEMLDQLNMIVHPAVREHFLEWCEERKDYKYIVKEAAIMFESGAYRDMDVIVAVHAPKNLRIKRVKERDNLSEAEVESRIKHQLEEKTLLELSDYVLYNDDQHLLIPQILQFHNWFSAV